MKKIIIGTILALLVIALIVAGTFLYQSLNSNFKGTKKFLKLMISTKK
ncbi:hypothetical protein [Staphylococcus sp. NAM3COL9]|nr:hypothetical protein [Staphylococcus sp. NAM3COL9]